jgi:hypothetical protein
MCVHNLWVRQSTSAYISVTLLKRPLQVLGLTEPLAATEHLRVEWEEDEKGASEGHNRYVYFRLLAEWRVGAGETLKRDNVANV